MRLARQLRMTRAELVAGMPADEFWLWLALESIDPIFDPWLANAVNTHSIASCFRKGLRLDSFLPIKPKKPRSSGDQIKALLRSKMKLKKGGVSDLSIENSREELSETNK